MNYLKTRYVSLYSLKPGFDAIVLYISSSILINVTKHIIGMYFFQGYMLYEVGNLF